MALARARAMVVGVNGGWVWKECGCGMERRGSEEGVAGLGTEGGSLDALSRFLSLSFFASRRTSEESSWLMSPCTALPTLPS